MAESYIAPTPFNAPMGFNSLLSGALSGAQQASYIEPFPGFNTADYADANGRIDYPRIQRELGISTEQMQQMVDSGAFNGGQQSGLTAIGQGDAWLSPEELRARTQAMGSNLGGADTGKTYMGSGTAAAGGQPTRSGSLLDGDAAASAASQYSSPNFGGFPQVSGGTPPNFLPGGIQNGGVPGGYIPGGPGSQVPGGAVAMTQPNAQAGLNRFYNTPGYQLTEGQGAVDRFQASPGYQYAVDQALGQVQRQASAQGLLGSGAALRAMTDRAQNMAMQDYGNWQNRQQQLLGDYQNRLAGLSGGPTGAEQAYGLGQGMGAGAMQTGSNISSLLGNQGSSLFGGIVNTGAAQAGNIMQAGGQQAQILGANQATNLAAAAAAGGGLF